MPKYIYYCDSCKQNFEMRQKITEKPLKACILCQSSKVKRVIHAPMISFKGSGFHVNDYGSYGPRETGN